MTHTAQQLNSSTAQQLNSSTAQQQLLRIKRSCVHQNAVDFSRSKPYRQKIASFTHPFRRYPTTSLLHGTLLRRHPRPTTQPNFYFDSTLSRLVQSTYKEHHESDGSCLHSFNQRSGKT
jgi:hypothetical protein